MISSAAGGGFSCSDTIVAIVEAVSGSLSEWPASPPTFGMPPLASEIAP